jgi:CheY-like chemotaxis protein
MRQNLGNFEVLTEERYHQHYNYFSKHNFQCNIFCQIADGILGIVEDLSFATTFDAGRVAPLQPRPFHLPTMLSDIVEAVKSVEQFGGRELSVKVNVAGVPEGISADPMLRRVLFNLVSNAMRFSPPGGEVLVNVEYFSSEANNSEENVNESPRGRKRARSEDGFKFLVKNSVTSPMDIAEAHKYFQTYYHNDSSISSATVGKAMKVDGEATKGGISDELQASHGLGLGLHVAYNMVQLMGGLLECSSSNTESCFWFTVRLALSQAEAPVSHVFTRVPAIISAPHTPDSSRSGYLCNVTETAAAGQHIVIEDLTPPDNMFQSPTSTAVSSPPNDCSSLIFDGSDVSMIRSPDGTNKHMRVLVVDDSTICQKMVTKALQKYDFLTDVACNGREACDKLTFTPCLYDAVLMDLRMPIMDGIEATRYCREVLQLKNLPIIALTAELGADTQAAIMLAGANQFVGKPAQTKDLIQALKMCHSAC